MFIRITWLVENADCQVLPIQEDKVRPTHTQVMRLWVCNHRKTPPPTIGESAIPIPWHPHRLSQTAFGTEVTQMPPVDLALEPRGSRWESGKTTGGSRTRRASGRTPAPLPSGVWPCVLGWMMSLRYPGPKAWNLWRPPVAKETRRCDWVKDRSHQHSLSNNSKNRPSPVCFYSASVSEQPNVRTNQVNIPYCFPQTDLISSTPWTNGPSHCCTYWVREDQKRKHSSFCGHVSEKQSTQPD